MERDEYIDAIRLHGTRLADAAAVDLDADVPSCPGWTAADLVEHAGIVCQFWEAIVSGDVTDAATFAPRVDADDADDAALIAGFRGDVDAIASTLAGLDPAHPCWTWSDRQEVGFVQRRLAHELAMHGWDASSAAGRPEPIEPSLAVDGIDEFLEVFVPSQARHADGPAITVHLHAIDAEGEWVVQSGEGQWHVERAHAKGDVAVRAPASDLLLMLWGRRPADDDGVEVFGAPDVLTDFLDRSTPG